MFENKKIFILGMARSGYESAKVLANHGCDVLVTDMKEQKEEHVKELESLGVTIEITDDPVSLLDDSFDYVVKNPGVKLDHPICRKALGLGIEIVSEVDVAYSFMKNVQIIGITGSNGKTTTTTLIYEFLKEHNADVYLGGNIGYPVCSLVDKVKDNSILVLEIAGHQLHDCHIFKTNVSVMTNLEEVHIDHFGTFDFYKENKAKIFNHHTSEDLAIYNIGNKDVVDKVKDINSTKVSFSALDSVTSDLYLKDNAIYYNDEKIIETKDIKIQGNHNYENIMCAIAATRRYGVTNEEIFNVLNRFGGVEHRIEYVKTVNGIDFYNDSKATNVKSTQIALNAFDKPTILILGGLDRGHSFDNLESYLKNTKLIVCYGETKDRIKDFADRINIKCIVKDNLIDATHECFNNAEQGDVILLSPACASWDQYKCFEDRGNEFKNVINSL